MVYSNTVIDLFEHIGILNTKRRENRCDSILPSIGQDGLTQLILIFPVEIIHEQPPQYDRFINFSESEVMCPGIVVSISSDSWASEISFFQEILKWDADVGISWVILEVYVCKEFTAI